MTAALTILAALASATALVAMLRQAGHLPQAAPNPRSLHVTPVPRIGGLAIWAGVLPAMGVAAVTAPMTFVTWGPAWLLLVLVSLRDDARSVSIGVRLATHAVCALWFASWSVPMMEQPVVYVMQVGAVALVVAWSLNLYNFMDGSDGLAALMSIIGFAAYGIAGAAMPMTGEVTYAIAAATVPFFLVNRPPARIFMGDVGAVPLGFLAAAFGVAGVLNHVWPTWFPLLVFLPFVADATLTLLWRAWRRERWWEGHRSHYYQRLHQLGAGHAGTLSVYAALMAGTSITAVVCLHGAPQWGWQALVAWCVALLLPFGAIDYHWRKKSTSTI